jgi:hypothetical protein
MSITADAPRRMNVSGTQAQPRSPLLAKLTSLTAIASLAAVGMIVLGVAALLAGNYTKDVVHDQLAPQKIFFPPKGSDELTPGIEQYAGQQLVDGDQAKAYANDFIAVHLKAIGGGKTYAEVSGAALKDPTNEKLQEQKTALFQGETLRGLLLGAWGWSVVGTVATLAGIVLIALGALLFILPLANWRVNLRRG